MNYYFLFLRNESIDFDAYTPEEMQRILSEFDQWNAQRGALHVAGASYLLWQALQQGATPALTTIGSNVPPTAVPQLDYGLTAAVLGYYAWNLLWIGVLVTYIGARLNWRNSRVGYWLNLTIVSAVDGGLVLLLVVPGYMALADGLVGIALWVPALICSTLGRYTALPLRTA